MDINDKFRRYDKGIDAARKMSRDAIHKVLLFSAGTLSLTVTMFSAFPSKIDVGTVQLSWYLLVAAIVTGYLTLFLHGRVLYAKTWKSFNTDQTIPLPYEYPFLYRIIAIPFAIFSLIFPANMILNKPNALNAPIWQKINHYTVHELAWFEHRIPFLENMTILFFVSGLIVLVMSVRF